MKVIKHVYRWVILFICLAALASCSGSKKLPFEVQLFLGRIQLKNEELTPMPFSILIPQKQKLSQTNIYLVKYQAKSKDNRIWDCLYLNSICKEESNSVGGGGCSLDGQKYGPLSVENSKGLGWEAVYGIVYDPKIAGIDILWDDGEKQSVRIFDGTYLAIRSNIINVMTKVIAKDKDGKIIYQSVNGN